MFNFFNWFSKELAIDLGTANTLVYVPRKGIVINEPSFVALDTHTDKIVAVGQKAKEMSEKTSSRTKIIRPLKDGGIADFRMATEMLKYFMTQALKRSRFVRPSVVIAVPSGITDVEKKAVRDSVLHLGANKVTIILEPMAAAIGAGLAVQRPSGNMVVDMGGGTTDVAVITMAGIVAGHSLRIAGDEMDEAIVRYVKQKYNLLIGLKSAETIKKIIGSAGALHIEQYIEVRGRDVARGVPSVQRISSLEIQDALAEPVFAIVEAVRQTLEETPPEVAADIMERGIVLTGGGALLKNLDGKLQEATGLPVACSDEPLTSVAVGAGMVMSEPKLLRKIAVN
jgi:rod shape-determining protein MreB